MKEPVTAGDTDDPNPATVPDPIAPSRTAAAGSGALDAETAEALRRELRLLEPGVRADRAAVLALLHPDFRELGTSGLVRDRSCLVEALATESRPAPSPPRGPTDGTRVTGPGTPVSQVADLICTRLAPDVVQITYTAQEPDRTSRRSSVWVREGDGPWLLRFHQGTVVPDPPHPSG